VAIPDRVVIGPLRASIIRSSRIVCRVPRSFGPCYDLPRIQHNWPVRWSFGRQIGRSLIGMLLWPPGMVGHWNCRLFWVALHAIQDGWGENQGDAPAGTESLHALVALHNKNIAGMLYGYARVSTGGQSLESQLEQLRAQGRMVFAEKISGAVTNRTALKKLLRVAKKEISLLSLASIGWRVLPATC
jgi:Resolvase, N terminal domain